MKRPQATRVGVLGRVLGAVLALPLAGACLSFSLFVLDYPDVDAQQAPHVKKTRQPNQANVFRDEGFSRFRTNRYGLIGEEPVALDAPGVLRVAVFGDSFVEALQVPASESLSGWLQRLLPPPRGYRRVEVWNFGFSGDNTGNAFARWVHRPANVHFDLAVVTFNAGDVFDNQVAIAKRPYGAFLVADGRGGFTLDEAHITARPLRPRELWVRQHLGRLTYSAYKLSGRVEEYLTDKLASMHAAPAPEPPPPAGERERLIADTCAQLLYVRAAMAAAGTTAILEALPEAETVLHPEHDPVYAGLTACLRAQSGVLVDPLPALARTFRDGVDPFRDWNEPAGHMNSIGHRIAASELISVLNRGALPAPSLR